MKAGKKVVFHEIWHCINTSPWSWQDRSAPETSFNEKKLVHSYRVQIITKRLKQLFLLAKNDQITAKITEDAEVINDNMKFFKSALFMYFKSVH